jgi:hypothetical protein
MAVGGALFLAAACAADVSDGEGQGQDFTLAGPTCEVTDVQSNKTLSAAELKQGHDDPVTNLLLTTPGCPKTLGEILDKLSTVDARDCENPSVETHQISEEAVSTNRPAPTRTVISRACGKRKKFDLLLSSRASTAGIDQQLGGPSFVEAIGRDTDGVFNFYSEEGGRWRVFGKGTDFIASGYDCKDGACLPKISGSTAVRCASCHPGGGLNMKELESPWVFWDQSIFPGAQETIQKTPALGARSPGASLEFQIVEPGNEEWVRTRVATSKTKGNLKELLRPLFCTIDMNLRTGFTSPSFVAQPDFFVDRTFKVKTEVNLSPDLYTQLIDAPDVKQHTRFGKDTPFPFIYPMRSAQDQAYQAELLGEHIVDDDFVRDVLFVDFTRPIYSSDRCGLLERGPATLADGEMNPQGIKAAWKKALDGATDGVAKQFLASLTDESDAAKHNADVAAFVAACDARQDKPQLMRDIVQWASHLRKAVTNVRNANGGIIEFPGATLPLDSLPEPAGGFDVHCNLAR